MVEVRDICTFVVLLIASIQDHNQGEIYLPVLSGLVDFLYPCSYIFLILFLFTYRFYQQYIGGADILIFILLCTRYSLLFVFRIVFLSSLIALVHALLLKKKSVRFIPYIFVSFIISIGMR